MREVISGIYCIENKVNGKKYIGQSIDIDERFKDHLDYFNRNVHYNKHLQRSWNTYGKENFKFYLIQECPKELLNDLEISIIEEFNTTDKDFGYNKTKGGEGVLGHKHSEETRKKLSEISSRQILSQETKDKIGNAHRNKFVSKETCEKISNAAICVGRDKIRFSSHVGVYFHKERIANPWEARITISPKNRIMLGVFRTEQEAIDAWENAYLIYFGKKYNKEKLEE